jgi:16S rRNA (cytosine1402-N4)-methyltransferase
MRTRRSTSSSDPVSGIHRSVLLHEAIDSLAIDKNDTVVDATVGGAGHARELVDRLGPQGTFIGLDLDSDAIARAREALKGKQGHMHFVEANFRNLDPELQKLGIEKINKALFDLGWSAYQLEGGRGFSFQKDEPLLMTYSKSRGLLNARTIVNEWSEESLSNILFGWGEERYARRIAKAIVERRLKKPFETSRELGDVIKAAVPARYRFARLHPATKTFQALRIAVNDELGALKDGLSAAWRRLDSGGRIAVITFHSIEDREVKQLFLVWEKEGSGKRLTKKPLAPTQGEVIENPRARSAKLRVIEKMKTTHQ